jgi:hypothetical protein
MLRLLGSGSATNGRNLRFHSLLRFATEFDFVGNRDERDAGCGYAAHENDREADTEDRATHD